MDARQVEQVFEKLGIDTELKRKEYGGIYSEDEEVYVNEIILDNVSS